MDDQGLQGSQGSQGSDAPQHPDSNMPDPIESRPYNAYRADVDPKPLEQRPRKHEDEKKLRKQNSQGLFVHDVSIVSARNDDQALMVFPAPCLALIAGGVVAQLL